MGFNGTGAGRVTLGGGMNEINSSVLYDIFYRRVMRDASRINRRVERVINAPLGESAQAYCDELNAQRKTNRSGEVVAPAHNKEQA
jgi:hypothetical protein